MLDGPCYDACVDACGDCVLDACEPEFSACQADRDCSCWLDCDSETQDCEGLCGPAPATWTDFIQCYGEQTTGGGPCERVCAE